MQSARRDANGQALVAVLAGGRALRMGGAKASVDLCGRPLIAYPLRAARDAGLDAVVVAKRASALPPLDERVLYEPDSPGHPLCGVLAALREGRPVLALGCDMPFVSAGLLAWLAAGEREPTVARLDGRVQPLPALYRPEDIPELERALAAEQSLRATLEGLCPRVVDERELSAFGDPRRLCFSVNDARDLRTAGRWMAG